MLTARPGSSLQTVTPVLSTALGVTAEKSSGRRRKDSTISGEHKLSPASVTAQRHLCTESRMLAVATPQAQRYPHAFNTDGETCLQEMCLSDIEEVLADMVGAGVHHGASKPEESAGISAPPVTENHPEPEGEVAQLLAELSAAANHFDASDYWVNGCWDLEGLKEDVGQQRDDHALYPEEVLPSSPSTQLVPSGGAAECNGQLQESDSAAVSLVDSTPSEEYPIFRRPRLLVLPFGSKDDNLARKLQRVLGGAPSQGGAATGTPSF